MSLFAYLFQGHNVRKAHLDKLEDKVDQKLNITDYLNQKILKRQEYDQKQDQEIQSLKESVKELTVLNKSFLEYLTGSKEFDQDKFKEILDKNLEEVKGN